MEHEQPHLDRRPLAVLTPSAMTDTPASRLAALNINTVELMPVSQSFAGFTVAREG